MKAAAFIAIAIASIGCAASAGGPSPAVESKNAPSAGASVASTDAPSTCARSIDASACEGAPSYDADVVPILERRCLSCHSGDGIAAEDHDFSIQTRVRAAKESIGSRVAACAMPPRGAPALTDDEARVLLQWLACAAK